MSEFIQNSLDEHITFLIKLRKNSANIDRSEDTIFICNIHEKSTL